jgi:hypothetical protein
MKAVSKRIDDVGDQVVYEQAGSFDRKRDLREQQLFQSLDHDSDGWVTRAAFGSALATTIIERRCT